VLCTGLLISLSDLVGKANNFMDPRSESGMTSEKFEHKVDFAFPDVF
jgi:hypothetical protein